MPRIALLFPGQGSHEPDMASRWLPQAATLYTSLSAAAGIALPGDADDAARCTATAVAQPAILATELAALAALRAAGVAPAVVAGHSLGEYAAAVAADVLDPRTAARVVAARGRAMAAACTARPGGLVVLLGVDADRAEELLAGTGATVANDNGGGQVVVGGTNDALAAAVAVAEAAGVRARRLPVEGAFHTSLMDAAATTLRTVLAATPAAEASVPLVSGLDGRARRAGIDVTAALADGMTAPVRWSAVMETVAAHDVDLVVEVGPGRALQGIARRVLPDVPRLGVRGPEDVAAVVAAATATTPVATPA